MGGTEFARFIEEELPRLRSYIARLPGARHADVDDLLQEALLRAYVARDRFESDEHAVNWICQVARNLLVDGYRRSLRQPVSPHAELHEIGDAAPDPADVVAAAEQAGFAVRALATLSQPQRELLWEHVVEGVSYAEIARRTARPLATVRSLAHRARSNAVEEFSRAGGALSALHAAALRPWRRLTHKLLALPPAAGDALVAGTVAIVVGIPPALQPPAAVPFPVTPPHRPLTSLGDQLALSARTTSPDSGGPVITVSDSILRRYRSVANRVAHSLPNGTFFGTYSSDCSFAATAFIPDSTTFNCRFTAIARVCVFTEPASPSPAIPTCGLEVLRTDLGGDAVRADGIGIGGTRWECESGHPGHATVRFRTSAKAPPIDIPMSVSLGSAEVSFRSTDTRLPQVSASFPFTCLVPHQHHQLGFHGTLRASD